MNAFNRFLAGLFLALAQDSCAPGTILLAPLVPVGYLLADPQPASLTGKVLEIRNLANETLAVLSFLSDNAVVDEQGNSGAYTYQVKMRQCHLVLEIEGTHGEQKKLDVRFSSNKDGEAVLNGWVNLPGMVSGVWASCLPAQFKEKSKT